MTEPDVIRGIERVTGETYDPETGQWAVRSEPGQPQTEPEPGEGLEVHAEPAAAAGGATEESGEETIVEAGDDGLDG